MGGANDIRRNTYSSTSALFTDASSLSKEDRLSYLNYKSNQLTQRNKLRNKKRGGGVVNKMANMLANYDQAHGIQKGSPKKYHRKTIASMGSLKNKVFPRIA